jgi:hypothetical protein
VGLLSAVVLETQIVKSRLARHGDICALEQTADTKSHSLEQDLDGVIVAQFEAELGGVQ